MASVLVSFDTKVGVAGIEKQTHLIKALVALRGGFSDEETMTVVSRILVALFFIIAGCFSFFIRKEKRRCRRKGKSCSCRNSQTSSEESIDSIDSMSVVEPTTWQMPPKGRKRTRTISGASNFSGVSTMSTLSEKDRMWLQAFRYAGR